MPDQIVSGPTTLTAYQVKSLSNLDSSSGRSVLPYSFAIGQLPLEEQELLSLGFAMGECSPMSFSSTTADSDFSEIVQDGASRDLY
jgi:hypothetical protein